MSCLQSTYSLQSAGGGSNVMLSPQVETVPSHFLHASSMEENSVTMLTELIISLDLLHCIMQLCFIVAILGGSQSLCHK